MRLPRKLLPAVAATGLLLVGLPMGGITATYLHALRGIGQLPHPTSAKPLPELIELGLWQAVGEDATAFQVESAWPWTPVFLLASAYLHRNRGTELAPAGYAAASQVAGLWLATKPRTGTAEGHLRRAAVTVWLTRHWSAAELTRELAARSFFGHGAIGIEAAARNYFCKTPEQLEIAETAMLMALLHAPSRFSPYRNPDRALERRNCTLRQWQEAGIITAAQAGAETAKPLRPAGASGAPSCSERSSRSAGGSSP